MQRRKIQFLLLDERDRKAGQFDNKHGERIEYGDAHQLVLLEVGTSQYIKKVTVAEERVDAVRKKLDNCSWGATIEVIWAGNEVVDVNVVSDQYPDQIVDI